MVRAHHAVADRRPAQGIQDGIAMPATMQPPTVAARIPLRTSTGHPQEQGDLCVTSATGC